MKKSFLIFSILLSGIVFTNAQTAPTTSSTTTKTATSKAEKKHKHTKTAETMYQCPMKCEAPNKISGKCAKCGMDKVKA